MFINHDQICKRGCLITTTIECVQWPIIMLLLLRPLFHVYQISISAQLVFNCLDKLSTDWKSPHSLLVMPAISLTAFGDIYYLQHVMSYLTLCSVNCHSVASHHPPTITPTCSTWSIKTTYLK